MEFPIDAILEAVRQLSVAGQASPFVCALASDIETSGLTSVDVEAGRVLIAVNADLPAGTFTVEGAP